ncbi:KdsC family phosphatase [Pontibacter akesuensis]|uniref:3-deoxy-D-manno-octulosonate 8-phosphate phosphatase (KDO 8-P phosphatase) n=1 Tax=Pontibacter akesuensis TaxID=388950 RepID=A0A1I7JMR6_9BACT|nr:HAD-IIIA family hydrolase [Pontibacter akesuensis]GHA68867.1 3-deoxy-D-manno-octulosonate 8-phosphate phosphatase [Pontibacter akesuensis]SFU86438.1 3-deoxy-D-manno-octulosonate 8-phosphate phosphatase (KDO 8-P phosphatase) [Pontibacter akesuensis]
MSITQTDLTRINTFVFDVDGVLTDGLLYCFADGEQVRAFNIKDGFAIKHALSQGYRVAIISGKNEPGVRKRLEQLGIEDIFLGIEDKVDTLENYLYMQGVHPGTVAYMGDDMPDFEVMQRCGLRACPADAADDIREISTFTSTKKGGRGAVRELIETIMKTQDTW